MKRKYLAWLLVASLSLSNIGFTTVAADNISDATVESYSQSGEAGQQEDTEVDSDASLNTESETADNGSDSIDAAVDSDAETQSDPSVQSDSGTQSDPSVQSDAGTQSDPSVQSDAEIQSDASTQTDPELAAKAEEERAASEEELGYIPGQILVSYDSNEVSEEEVAEVTEDKDATVSETIEVTEDTSVAVVDISDDMTVDAAVEAIEQDEKIVSAQPNYILESFDDEETVQNIADENSELSVQGVNADSELGAQDANAGFTTQNISTNDSYLGNQWYLDRINTEAAWNTVQSSNTQKVKVAILDTGVEYTHEDLNGMIDTNLSKQVTSSGFESLSATDSDGHGTHVTGIVGANTNNGKGVAGIASTKNNSVLDLFVVGVVVDNKILVSNVVRSIEYAVSQGASVINMSLGEVTSVEMPVFENACNAAYQSGVTIVCAAGNSATKSRTIPADFDSTISVINMNQWNQKAFTSNYGATKDLSAPGTSILNTYHNGLYLYETGTSMAAPMVTAAVALMKSVNPSLTPAQIRSILRNTATDIGDTGYDEQTGAGCLNVGAAVAAAKSAGNTGNTGDSGNTGNTGDSGNTGNTDPVTPDASVSYVTHVQTYGWQNSVADGATSGTTGEAKRLEGIQIKVSSAANIGVQYRTHVQTYGWESDWKSDGATSGTTGEAKRLEAIQIQLTGADSNLYDIYYRVHAQTFGWMGWAKNGACAGTAGYAKRLEAIEIKIVKKGEAAPGSTDDCYRHPLVEYNVHCQTYGWMSKVNDGAEAGTTGQAKRLEGIQISLNNQDYSGDIQYKTHIQTYGWESDWRSNGDMSGTSGEAKRLEAIQIQLTDDMAQQYDVYYRVHAQTFGWLGWAKNGEPAGTEGFAKRLESIQIELVPKGWDAPGSTDGAFYVQ